MKNKAFILIIRVYTVRKSCYYSNMKQPFQGDFPHTLLRMGVMLMNTFEVITLLLSFGIFLIALLTYIDKRK